MYHNSNSEARQVTQIGQALARDNQVTRKLPLSVTVSAGDRPSNVLEVSRGSGVKPVAGGAGSSFKKSR